MLKIKSNLAILYFKAINSDAGGATYTFGTNSTPCLSGSREPTTGRPAFSEAFTLHDRILIRGKHMKVIISHDVDHLYTKDHYGNDLILPKLMIRSALQWTGLYREKITTRELLARLLLPFQKDMNHIEEVCNLDEAYHVPSTFFFGMASGLGMSYKPAKALPFIQYVTKRGFAAGVHGICYDNTDGIQSERKRFIELTGCQPAGIRMHYVRFNAQTFPALDAAGYVFDSTEFDKATGCSIKSPYRVGTMWEFPLTIMDGYLPYDFEKAKDRTLEILQQAEAAHIEYATVLFHDASFCEAWSQTKKWYTWFLQYINDTGYKFISFQDAIKELEISRHE